MNAYQIFVTTVGVLSHDMKDCPELAGKDKQPEVDRLQYEAWLRGELTRKTGQEASPTETRGMLERRGNPVGRTGEQSAFALRSPAHGDILSGKTESNIAHIEKSTKEIGTKVAEEKVQEIETFPPLLAGGGKGCFSSV